MNNIAKQENAMNMKQCKLCPNITEDATYVSAINGWRCGDCSLSSTGKFNVTALRKEALEDLNPLDDQPLRATVRRHLAHLESL